MLGELMGLEIHVRLEDDKFLLHALFVVADEVVTLEMQLQLVVVTVVVRYPRVPAIADEAPLVLVATVLKQLVAVVKPFAAEAAQRMPLEPRGVAVVLFGFSELHMVAQLFIRVHLVLVGEDLLVPRTQVAHLLVVDGADMAVEVGPAETSKVAGGFGTVVPKQQHRVADNVFAGIPDTDVLVRRGHIAALVVFVLLGGVVGEDDVRGTGLEHVSIRASLRHVMRYSLDSVDTPCSCRVLVTAGSRCGRWSGCRGQPRGGRWGWRR